MNPQIDDVIPAWSWDAALTGVVPPLISPLTASRRPDRAALERVIGRVLDHGCSGLFVLGGCGEGAWLTTAQRRQVIRGAVAVTAGRAPVLVGVMLPATGPAVEAARQAEAEGADAVVAGSPYYGESSALGQERHIEAILRAVSLPVLLYNIPQSTHNVVLPSTAGRLAREPRVLGIKDSAGDLGALNGFLGIKRVRPAFRVLQGNEHGAASSLLLGADGLVPGMANFAPALYVALRAAAAAGDIAACASLQATIGDLWTLHGVGHWLTALKAACALTGLGNGMPSAPLRPATRTERSEIAAILERHALLTRG
jgi:4-hydroxy-tetrahydrodipicolinate synthase